MNTDQTREAIWQAALNYQHTVASEYRLEDALAKHEAACEAKALREFADAVRMPFTVFRGENGYPITVGDLLRETAARIGDGDE